MRQYENRILDLERIRRTDYLTGCGNYFAFAEYITNLASLGIPFTIILFDMTNLKAANQELGHFGADTILQRVGSVVRREEGFRHGGDEFAVVLRRDAAALAVRARVERACGVQRLPSGVNVQIVGAIGRHGRGSSVGLVVNAVDKALEKRKARVKACLEE